MKNILINCTAIILVYMLFCFKHKGDPEQQRAQKRLFKPLDEQHISKRVRDSILTADTNLMARFSWRLVKKSIVENNQSQSLTIPFLVGNSQQNEMSLELHDNCCSELIPTRALFLNLGNIEIKSITKPYLRSQAFNKNKIYTAQPSTSFWPNQLYAGTVIACKTADGNYSLLKIRSVKSKASIELEIYQSVN